jgi:molybdopterin-guanine dinucleotide biosynthesis protein
MRNRRLLGQIMEALSDSPVVLLNGARQTGKTTLVRDLLPRRRMMRYLTLDDLAVLNAAKADPGGSSQDWKAPRSSTRSSARRRFLWRSS